MIFLIRAFATDSTKNSDFLKVGNRADAQRWRDHKAVGKCRLKEGSVKGGAVLHHAVIHKHFSMLEMFQLCQYFRNVATCRELWMMG